MSRPAIVVEDLGKSYRLGAASMRSSSLREALTQAMTSPLRRVREAGEAGEDEAQTFWAPRDVSFEVRPGEVVAARSGENVSLDSMPGFASVEILPGPDTPSMIIGRSDGGCVRPPSACHHFPTASLVSAPIS